MSFFGRKLSIKGVPVSQATDKQLILKEDYDNGNTLYYDTSGNPTVLLGNRLANMTNGIGTTQRGLFVSQSGIDVTQATNSQLVFNSGQDTFKIVAKIQTPFTLTSGGVSPSATTVIATHGLGYVPLTFGTVTITADPAGGQTGIFTLPYFSAGTGGGTTNVFIIRSYVKMRGADSSTITYEIGELAPNLTITGTITTYVLQETAT